MRVRFPGETAAYREARDRLLAAEAALRDQVEAVAAERRALPAGGVVPEDYRFEDAADGRAVALSSLFGDHDTLLVYSFMYGATRDEPCPLCVSLLDGYDATVRTLTDRVAFVAVAGSPPARLRAFAELRGWRSLRLLSAAGNGYSRAYHGERDGGADLPMMNVFVRRDGAIRHTWGSEMLFADSPAGQDSRHLDLLWPLWNMLDLTPTGRGADWYPDLPRP